MLRGTGAGAVGERWHRLRALVVESAAVRGTGFGSQNQTTRCDSGAGVGPKCDTCPTEVHLDFRFYKLMTLARYVCRLQAPYVANTSFGDRG